MMRSLLRLLGLRRKAARLPSTRALLGWRNRPVDAPIHGYIAYYHLTDWWLSTFSRDEREDIEWACAPLGSTQHLLTDGVVAPSPRSQAEFLTAVERGIASLTDRSIHARLQEGIVSFGGDPHPERMDGRHFTSYAEQVKQLRREGQDAQAEALLFRLIDAAEADARVGVGIAYGSNAPPPWYYEQLAIIYHKRKDTEAERAILERFARQQTGRGVKPPKLLERLEKLRAQH